MLSHHAPPRRLLDNFRSSLNEGDKPTLWVYSKSGRPRSAFKITSESAEHGYFAGDPYGRTEEEIDSDLNDRFESPFNRLLPALSKGLVINFDRDLIAVCANYMATLFLRSKPRREATKQHLTKFSEAFAKRLDDPLTLRRYAAKVSFYTGQPVDLALVRGTADRFLQAEMQTEEAFFQSATTDFSQLPTVLGNVHWSLCSSPHVELLQSDAAVALLCSPPERMGHTEFGYGIHRAGSKWYLPVSPRFALRASNEYIRDHVLSFQEADLINEYLVRAAFGFVYSCSRQPVVEAFVRRNIYSLKFYEHLIVGDLEKELDVMISGLTGPDSNSRPGAHIPDNM